MRHRWIKRPELWHSSEYLMQRYKNTGSIAVVAKASGLSESTISRRMRAIDPSYAQSNRRWSIERRKAFLSYLRSHSLRQTAKQLGVNHATLWHWFRAMHPEYSAIARSGIFASTSDWLNSRQARRQPEKAQSVETWLLDNLPALIESEGQSELESHSLRRERNLSRRELPLIEQQI